MPLSFGADCAVGLGEFLSTPDTFSKATRTSRLEDSTFVGISSQLTGRTGCCGKGAGLRRCVD